MAYRKHFEVRAFSKGSDVRRLFDHARNATEFAETCRNGDADEVQYIDRLGRVHWYKRDGEAVYPIW
jgi:hypothetical protein